MHQELIKFWAKVLKVSNVKNFEDAVTAANCRTFADVIKSQDRTLRTITGKPKAPGDRFMTAALLPLVPDIYDKAIFNFPLTFYDLPENLRTIYIDTSYKYLVQIRKTNLSADEKIARLTIYNPDDHENLMKEIEELMEDQTPDGAGIQDSSSSTTPENQIDNPENSSVQKAVSISDIQTAYLNSIMTDEFRANVFVDDDFKDVLAEGRNMELVTQFAKEIAEADLSAFLKTFKMFEYQGFDPFTTWAMLKAYSGKTNTTEFKCDMIMCCVLFLTRGTSIVSEKKMEKLSENGRNIVRNLKKKYNIQPKLNHSSNRLTITLSRITATLPQAVVAFLNDDRCGIERPVSLPAIRAVFDKFPPYMRSSCFLALIPKEKANAPYIMAMIHHQVLESKIINSYTKNKNQEDVIKDALTYAKSALDSKVTDDPIYRASLFSKYNTIPPETLKEWETKFKELYPLINVVDHFGLD